ncbi:MAG: helix-turn-helix domain-containing protein [Gemmatimonadetes bacterium]|nr:helix-turn-helix domain-containing protein [Gemmatimonadota bacterium]
MPRIAVSERTAPAAVVRAARRLGSHIKTARKRRRLRQVELARMAGITVQTLRRVETGSLGTGMGAYLAALWAMGLDSQVADLASPEADIEGQTLEAAGRGERVRPSGKLNDEF